MNKLQILIYITITQKIILAWLNRLENTHIQKTRGKHPSASSQIYTDNKDKSGIYRWTNNLNGKTYVGSGVNLAKRLRSYFNVKELNRKSSPIQDALLKYGHSSFTLEIMEYTTREKVIHREQYYINLLVPEYNVLNNAYSLLGFKHSQETLDKLKSKVISAEHKSLLSSVHRGKTVSSETREKLSIATSNYRRDNPLTAEALLNIKNKTIALASRHVKECQCEF